MTRNFTIAAVFILGCLVFTAGCSSSLQSDLFIVKLYGNGTFAWIQIVEAETGTTVIETTDGGYLITGGTFPDSCGNYGRHTKMTAPSIIKLSPQGTIEWFNNYSYGKEGLISAVQNMDGSIEAVSESGVILILDQEGRLLRNSSVEDNQTSDIQMNTPQQNVVRINKDRTILDNKTLKNSNTQNAGRPYDSGFFSVYEKDKGAATYYRLVKSDTAGNILWDKPFLTLRSHPVKNDFWDMVIINQILQTSDQDYVILGQRQMSVDC